MRDRVSYQKKYHLDNQEKRLEDMKNYRRSLPGLIQRMYPRMVERDKKFRGIEIDISKEEFLVLVEQSKYILEKLHREWVKSDYSFDKTPSVDRIDNTKGYSVNNIQFISKGENSSKSNLECIRNPPKGQNKKKIKLIKGDEVKYFDSGKDACDFLGKGRTVISRALKNNSCISGWKPSYV